MFKLLNPNCTLAIVCHNHNLSLTFTLSPGAICRYCGKCAFYNLGVNIGIEWKSTSTHQIYDGAGGLGTLNCLTEEDRTQTFVQTALRWIKVEYLDRCWLFNQISSVHHPIHPPLHMPPSCSVFVILSINYTENINMFYSFIQCPVSIVWNNWHCFDNWWGFILNKKMRRRKETTWTLIFTQTFGNLFWLQNCSRFL